MTIKCPQCHGETAVEGKIYNQIDYINPQAFFRPSSLPFYAVFNTNIQLKNSFFACSSCGFMWSRIDSQQLQKFITTKKAF